ncbi:dendritic cell-specific transmembrane protein [Gouania willdenowi]|uniref:dendritic cell-specific transmembrane protein n=1 Tax=Gouania willdenowi TaxID=441366 RepID=UPI0010548433|nr:dendritic cell-specific transmembrane protein [Gouania willdenowi]
MQLSCIQIKQTLEDVGLQAVDVFTSERRDGFKCSAVLLLTCCLSSLLLSSLLLLYLLYTLDYTLPVAGGITTTCGTLLTVAFFFSKRVRCTGALFVVSIFMKKSRNLLLTAGTTLVVVKNIRNTVENLTRLGRSMICNLKVKKASLMDPFSNYVKMLKWIGNLLKGVTDLGVLNLDHQLKVSPRLESEKFRLTLSEAERRLNETVKYAQTVMNTVSSVTDKLFPAISLLLLLMFIALHVKKYCNDVKYKNRFISSKFREFDERQKAEGNLHVLPLTSEEEKLYRSIPSLRLSSRNGKTMLKFGRPVISHLLAWLLFIAIDALLYWFVDIITRKLSELKPFDVPLLMSIKSVATIIGIPFGTENQEKEFSYSVTLFEKKCLPKPKLLLSSSMFPLAAILLPLVIMTLMAAKVPELQLMICERFFSSAAEVRVQHLHSKILGKRLKPRKQQHCSLRSQILKLHFWCPLLFQAKKKQQSIA